VAEAKTTSRTRAAAEAATAKAPRRRISKRKAVEQHARSYFDAFARRDPDGMAAHWDPDGVEEVVPMSPLRGPAAIAAYFRELFAAVPDLEATVSRVVTDDRHAAVEWRATGSFDGAPFQGIAPTGRRIELRGFDLLEIEEGRILSNTVYFDGASFARQIGMLPPQDSGAERAMKNAFNAVTRVRRAISERTGS
jgi:steroid delta-isomerase-like uncharacterized protein